jgi:hypothetical protein
MLADINYFFVLQLTIDFASIDVPMHHVSRRRRSSEVLLYELGLSSSDVSTKTFV